jgi:hypothetical protein
MREEKTLTLAQIQQANLELESVGVIYRAGERDGKPVWALTEFGEKLRSDPCRAEIIESLLEKRKTGETSAELQARLPHV